MGWGILKKFKTPLILHGGTTSGHFTYIGFDKKQRKGDDQGKVTQLVFHQNGNNMLAKRLNS
jgi:hypothetical protein